MELQQLFNVILGVSAFLVGWVLNNITRAIDRLDVDVRGMPLNYVSKDDYRRDINDIKQMCRQIFDKLDSKADK